MIEFSDKTINNELNAKYLNDRLIRSISEVIHREVEDYLSERLKDYSLYKDAYEQVMSISLNSSQSPTCLELKKEIEDLKEQLNEYRQMFDLPESDGEGENISLSIKETLNTDTSQIEFVEPIMPKNIESERSSFWCNNDFQSTSPQANPEDSPGESPEDEEEEGEEEEEEEEEEVYEITISGKKYYTTDEKKKNGDVFEILPDEDVGPLIGRFKDGKFKKVLSS